MASKLKPTTTKTLSGNGSLPKGWRMVRFGDVVRDVNETERNPLAAGLERFIGLEHIEPENLHLKKWGLLADGEVSFTKRFRKGQVLFGKRRAYQRKVAVAEFDGICSSDILTFEPKDDSLIPELLPFIVQSDGFFEHALGTSSGSLSPRTRWSQLKEYEFPLPPIREQHRIATLLWGIEDLCKCYEQVLSSEEACRIAVLRHMLSSGTKNEPLVKSAVGLIPQSWKTVSIRDVVVKADYSLLAGPFGTIFKAKDFRPSGIPIVQLRHITEHGFFWGINNTFMDTTVYERLHKPYTVRSGDLLITKLGEPPGLACLYPEDMPDGMVTPDVVRAVLDESLINNEFAVVLFNILVRPLMTRITKGGTRPRVSLDELFSIALPLPELKEQYLIASVARRFTENRLARLCTIAQARELGRRYVASLHSREGS